MDSTSALQRIGVALAKVRRVEKLLRKLGQLDTHLPLSRRYALIVAQPLDLAADDKTLELRSELMRAMAALMQQLQREFLSSTTADNHGEPTV